MRLFCVLFGGLCLLDTAFALSISRPNLGVLLPGLIGLPLLLIGIFYPVLQPWCQQGLGRACKYLLAGVYVLGALALGITWGVMGSAIDEQTHPETEVYFVLGAGVRKGVPSLTLRHRLDRAYECYLKNPDALFVVSGGLDSGESKTEAEVMEAYLLNRGMPRENLLVENKATSTRENLLFSCDLLQQQGIRWERGACVSTNFHIWRAKAIARNCGLQLQGVSAPGVWYLAPNNWLREAAAIWAYALTGNL